MKKIHLYDCYDLVDNTQTYFYYNVHLLIPPSQRGEKGPPAWHHYVLTLGRLLSDGPALKWKVKTTVIPPSL